jgi:hypothetical protein
VTLHGHFHLNIFHNKSERLHDFDDDGI